MERRQESGSREEIVMFSTDGSSARLRRPQPVVACLPVEDCPHVLRELEARFSAETACREYLAQRWPGGFHCLDLSWMACATHPMRWPPAFQVAYSAAQCKPALVLPISATIVKAVEQITRCALCHCYKQTVRYCSNRRQDIGGDDSGKT